MKLLNQEKKVLDVKLQNQLYWDYNNLPQRIEVGRHKDIKELRSNLFKKEAKK